MLRPAVLCLVALAVLAGAKKDEKEIDGPVIGIDLGTTYSCVGNYRNGQVKIIPKDQGNRITPSYAASTDDEHMIGEATKNRPRSTRTMVKLGGLPKFTGKDPVEEKLKTAVKSATGIEPVGVSVARNSRSPCTGD